MANYRVSKIRNNEGEAIGSELFQSKMEAEIYAQTTSASDNAHFYVVEEKTDTGIEYDEDDDFDDIKYFVNGEIGARF